MLDQIFLSIININQFSLYLALSHFQFRDGKNKVKFDWHIQKMRDTGLLDNLEKKWFEIRKCQNLLNPFSEKDSFGKNLDNEKFSLDNMGGLFIIFVFISLVALLFHIFHLYRR